MILFFQFSVFELLFFKPIVGLFLCFPAVVNSGEPSSDDHDDVHKDSHPNQSASSPFDETNDTSDSRLVIVEEDEEPAAASSASSATSSPRKSILRNKGVRRKRQLTSILQVFDHRDSRLKLTRKRERQGTRFFIFFEGCSWDAILLCQM